MAVRLRPALAEDEAFLREVYASTRADELALVPWSSEQKESFVLMQFEAQGRHYRAHNLAAEWSIILRDGTPVGRMIVDRSEGTILLMDIALLPAHRNAGLGSRLLRDLQEEAVRTGKPIRLHVETFNRAQRLYRRLGFVPVEEAGMHVRWEWAPPASAGQGCRAAAAAIEVTPRV